MKYFTILVLFILEILASKGKRVARIVGGYKTSVGQYPYQVSLQYKNAHICSGSIIHNEWIITAAHCGLNISTTDLKVVAGLRKLKKGGTMYDVLEVHTHENFDIRQIQNDVGIIKVKRINYTDLISPITLETEYVKGWKSCVVSGWGLTSFPGNLSNTLKYISLNTTTNKFCKKYMRPISKNQICTYTKPQQGVCVYDSGGPLVWNNKGAIKQIGIVSWTMLCALGFPDVYSRVSSFVDWFRDKCKHCF